MFSVAALKWILTAGALTRCDKLNQNTFQFEDGKCTKSRQTGGMRANTQSHQSRLFEESESGSPTKHGKHTSSDEKKTPCLDILCIPSKKHSATENYARENKHQWDSNHRKWAKIQTKSSDINSWHVVSSLYTDPFNEQTESAGKPRSSLNNTTNSGMKNRRLWEYTDACCSF